MSSQQATSSTGLTGFSPRDKLRKFYAAVGKSQDNPLDEPLLSRARLVDIQEKLTRLQLVGKGKIEARFTLQDIHQVSIKFTLTKVANSDERILQIESSDGRKITVRLGPDLRICIGCRSFNDLYQNTDLFIAPIELEDLVRQGLVAHPPGEPQQGDPKGLNHCPSIQRQLVFGFGFTKPMVDKCIPASQFTKRVQELEAIWEKSKLRETLIAALKKAPESMRPVHRIVCFGMGNPFIEVGKHVRYMNQHFVARTIAQTLSGLNDNPKDIEIFSQEVLYPEDSSYKTALKSTLNIQMVDWVSEKGLSLIEANTLVIAVLTPPFIIQAAIDQAWPDGPAGLLCEKFTANIEAEMLDILYDDHLDPNAEIEARRVGVPDRLWKYREVCERFPSVTDEKWLGKGLQPDSVGSDTMFRVDTELLLRKK